MKWTEINNNLGHRFNLNAGDLGGHVLKRGRVWIVQVLTPSGSIYVHKQNVKDPMLGKKFAEMLISMLMSGVRTRAEQKYIETVYKHVNW